jgi:hypothetical protein
LFAVRIHHACLDPIDCFAESLTANGIAVDMAIAVISGSPAFWVTDRRIREPRAFMNWYGLQNGEGLPPCCPLRKLND